MDRDRLAKKLISTIDAAERRRMIARQRASVDRDLAAALRDSCYAAWMKEPAESRVAASVLAEIAAVTNDRYITATAKWAAGIAAITRGKFAQACARLATAANEFAAMKDAANEASARVALMLALSMIGSYDEASANGRKALRRLKRTGDRLAAGKIELNLSNIYARRSQMSDAIRSGRAAVEHFMAAGDEQWLAMAENSLANSYLDTNDLDQAAKFFERALRTAEIAGSHSIVAETRASLGILHLTRSEFGTALRDLESSRSIYDGLDMPHHSATADLEIAEIYLELGLTDEARSILERVAGIFRSLKMRAELGRAELDLARAELLSDPIRSAAAARRAATAFKAERNNAGLVSAETTLADAVSRRGRHQRALEIVATATDRCGRDMPRQSLALQVTRAEIVTRAGAQTAMREWKRAERLATTANSDEYLRLALVAIGREHLSSGKLRIAARVFERAAAIVERLEAPVGSDAITAAMLASRLDPFDELCRVRLRLGEYEQAFHALERGRSNAYLMPTNKSAGGRSIVKMLRMRRELRSRLNRAYIATDDAASIAKLEKDLTDIERRIASLAGGSTSERKVAAISEIAKRLGSEGVFVEYFETGETYSAFVIADGELRFFGDIVRRDSANALMAELRFQFEAVRYGTAAGRFAGLLRRRTDDVLSRLGEQLLAPIADLMRQKHLVISPAGELNSVPFAALRIDENYLAEQYDISLTPSANVWMSLKKRRRSNHRRSLAVAFSDESIPLAESEARTVGRALAAKVLTGKRATFDGFIADAPNADVIHIACHGQFRFDNAMYSNLRLADGWLTVADICALDLRAQLVTLSACETGIQHVEAGNELFGLARGFFTAGVPSLVVSLWTVNDNSTRRLMLEFYRELDHGRAAAASLAHAQRRSISRGEHPYNWSTFVHFGV